MYEVIFDTEAIEFLNKLPKEVKARIYNKVNSTKENPFHLKQAIYDCSQQFCCGFTQEFKQVEAKLREKD